MRGPARLPQGGDALLFACAFGIVEDDDPAAPAAPVQSVPAGFSIDQQIAGRAVDKRPVAGGFQAAQAWLVGYQPECGPRWSGRSGTAESPRIGFAGGDAAPRLKKGMGAHPGAEFHDVTMVRPAEGGGES